MATTAYLLNLLHLSDPMLPIGGYSHSSGLETYVQQQLVHDRATATEFVQNMLAHNFHYNDAAFETLAYRAAKAQDLPALFALDEECTALKGPREMRQASQKLGLRLLKVFRGIVPSPLIDAYETGLKTKEAHSHYAVVFGLIAQEMGIPETDALTAFYYNAAAGIVTNAVKLVPLGQMDGQSILFELHGFIENLVPRTLALDRSLVGVCNVGFDIRCMQHERLYSRLYMS